VEEEESITEKFELIFPVRITKSLAMERTRTRTEKRGGTVLQRSHIQSTA